MLANVQGLILGESKDAPTEKLRERSMKLSEVVQFRIHEARAPGTGSTESH